MIDKILEWEDKTKKWIENHKVYWCFMLVGIGITLGFVGNLYLGGSLRQGFLMSAIYSFTLVTAELTLGGSGID